MLTNFVDFLSLIKNTLAVVSNEDHLAANISLLLPFISAAITPTSEAKGPSPKHI